MIGRDHRKQALLLRLKKGALLPLLILLVSLLAVGAEDIRCKWSGVDKIIAVGDIHGDYENLTAILRGVGLVNDRLDWIGGKTHLVQMGDVMDRGKQARAALDLLRKLERQATQASGMVHVLIGNHEEANIVPIAFDTPGYVTVEQFLDFLPEKYVAKKEKAFLEEYAKQGQPDGGAKAALRDFWEGEIRGLRGFESRIEYADFFYDHYGEWLLTKNIAIKINDIVFVHGGFTETFAEMDLKQLNQAIRSELKAFSVVLRDAYKTQDDTQLKKMRNDYVTQPNAPHWFRGLVRNPEDEYADTVTRTLEKLNAIYMVVGHTVRQPEVIKARTLDRFGKRIWAIDVGISDYYNDILCALIIDHGEFAVWWGDDVE